MIPNNEYIRKLIHLFNLVIPIAYVYVFPEKWTIVKILTVFMILFILVDIFRHSVGWVRSIFNLFFDRMLRTHEQGGKFTGATWVLIGAVVSIILFSKPVAILALVYMSLGDSTAGLIGRQYGKHKIWDKSWEGFFGGLFVCLIIAWNFPSLPLTVSISGALAAMLMEIIPIPLDDNFKIPLGSGAIMMMFSTPI